jgi:Ricin-type beta-trefoil lectin domain
MRTVFAAIRRHHRDQDGSLPLIILFTVVGLGVSATLTTVVLSESTATHVATQRNVALDAAQSGLDVALANIRATVRASDGSGDPAHLPCAALTGVVNPGSTTSYTAALYYLATKPPSGNAAWAAANKLTCTPGSGPAALPAYLMIVSTGQVGGTQTTRTITATYAFTSTVRNDRILGGNIKNYDINGVNNFCLTAGNSPAVGTQLAVENCDTTKAGQQFIYQNGLTISLKGTSLCADGRTTAVNLSEQAGNKVTLQNCATDPVPHQIWSHNDDAAFAGTDDGLVENDLCWNIVASKIVLADLNTSPSTCGNKWGNSKSFFPASDVGTGRAGSATGQLVNSDQLGRCVDVTANDVNWGFLIVFPCKQSVTGTVLWNQTWKLPSIPAGDDSATGYVYTTYSGTKYCLRSPGTASTADRGDGSPASTIMLQSCTAAGAPPANLAWTVNLDTGRWTSSYRIESTFNAGLGTFCLAAADPNGPAITQWSAFNVTFSKLVLASCSGSDLLKWNAFSHFYESSLTDIVER